MVGWVLGAGLVAVLLVGMIAGAVAVTPADVWHMAGVRLGLIDEPDRLTDSVLWAIRLPRVLAGLVAGAGMGAAGVALQGAFRNPMADPHLIGISPAAGLGAVLGIAVTPALGSQLPMVLGAALGGIVLALVMQRIAANVVDSGQLVLVGIAIGFAVLAALGAIVLGWDSPRVPTFTFWVFGGLSGATWSVVLTATPFVAAGIAAIAAVARPLDLIALGEDEARHLGVDVARVRALVLGGVGVAVGGAVALSGVVGFVGLVVPTLLRHWLGPSHRRLIALSAVGGAIALAALDIVSRTVAAPIEIPVGLITAVGGAPVLVWFLLRRAQ
ncbi:MAG: iron ABC transporter permease [Acidimicrobiia bacterium]